MSSCYAVMIVNGIAECSGYYMSECGKRLGCIEEHFDEKKVSQKVSGLPLYVYCYYLLSSSPSLPPFLSLTLSLSLSLSHPFSLSLSSPTMQLCIFLNNVNHICSTVSECSKWLNLDPLYDWLDEKQKIGGKCRSVVERIIQENHEAMCNCIITSEIAKIVCTSLLHLCLVLITLLYLQSTVSSQYSATTTGNDPRQNVS